MADPGDTAPNKTPWSAATPVSALTPPSSARTTDTPDSIFDHQMAPHSDGTVEVMSPNGQYEMVWSDSAEAYKIYGLDGTARDGAFYDTEPLLIPHRFAVDNFGNAILLESGGTEPFELESTLNTAAPPEPNDVSIDQIPWAEPAVQASIRDGNAVLHKILSQFGSKKPEIVQPYALNPSNIAALEQNQGAGADAYNNALNTVTDQERSIGDQDKAAIAASAKIVNVHNVHRDNIVKSAATLNHSLRTISPPNQLWNHNTMLDPVLQVLSTTIDSIQNDYQQYCDKVVEAVSQVPKQPARPTSKTPVNHDLKEDDRR
ncbi:hypothetical protein [Nocardia heshunensis]